LKNTLSTLSMIIIGTEPEYGDVERAFVAAPRASRGRAAGGR
jgi:hypothetical protein